MKAKWPFLEATDETLIFIDSNFSPDSYLTPFSPLETDKPRHSLAQKIQSWSLEVDDDKAVASSSSKPFIAI